MTAPVAMPAVPPAAPGFVSPVPVQPTGLGNALASEWTKIRTVRSTVWTLGVMFAVVIGIGLLVTWAMDAQSGRITDPLLSGGLFGLMLGQIAVLTLGVLVVTSEYSTGMIRTTFTACPQRLRVLAAKAIVFFGLSFAVTTVACTLVALINYAVLKGKVAPEEYGLGGAGGGHLPTGGAWLGATVGAAAFVAVLGVLALAVGTLLRHTAGGVVTMIGVVLLPPLVALFMAGDSLASTRRFLIKYSVINGLASLYRTPMIGGGHGGLPALGVLALVTAVVFTAACVVLSRRDV
jgi:ABC-2 type transport system permease protein